MFSPSHLSPAFPVLSFLLIFFYPCVSCHPCPLIVCGYSLSSHLFSYFFSYNLFPSLLVHSYLLPLMCSLISFPFSLYFNLCPSLLVLESPPIFPCHLLPFYLYLSSQCFPSFLVISSLPLFPSVLVFSPLIILPCHPVLILL